VSYLPKFGTVAYFSFITDAQIIAQNERMAKQSAELDEMKTRLNEALHKVQTPNFFSCLHLLNSALHSLLPNPNVLYNSKKIFINAQKTYGMNVSHPRMLKILLGVLKRSTRQRTWRCDNWS